MNYSRRVAVALAVVGWFVWFDAAQVPLQAARTYDWCYETCDAEEDCDTECENDGGGTITCGEYDGGPGNGWCDGDTCDDICGPYSAPSWECYDQGSPSDCGTYGDSAECDDGYCAVNEVEDCDSCPEDCGECPEIECGDELCEPMYGETPRNCPEDCYDPPGATCNDETCEPGEGPECEECIAPKEYCGWDYGCLYGWECVGNQCVHSESIGSFPECVNQASCNSLFPNDPHTCVTTRNLMTGGTKKICLPWYIDIE